MKKETKILHSIEPDLLTGAISTPIYQTATFVQDSPGVHRGFDYGRTNNPTRAVLEKLIATLENGSHGFAFASGLAAIDAVIKLLNSGDQIVAVDDLYVGTWRTLNHIYNRLGIQLVRVDCSDIRNLKASVTDKTKLIWIESPTNPTLKIADIKEISLIAQEIGALLVVDNTFASPILQNPIDLGADIVIHSATKYLAGHSDLIAGLVVTRNSELAEQIKFIQNSSGAILGPFDSWLTIRGIETLALRVNKQCDNAESVAQFLASHPLVKRVNYPGLNTHPNHEIAKKQQSRFGAMISFSLKTDTVDAGSMVCSSTTLFKLAESLGGVKSLICQPALMTHKSIPQDVRHAAGIDDSLIRISCGIENADDLIDDLKQALNKI